MRIIFKDGQILDLNSVEKIIIEPTDGDTLSNIEFLKISLFEYQLKTKVGSAQSIKGSNTQ